MRVVVREGFYCIILLSKVYKYSRAQMCCLTAFCVKLTYIYYSDFTVPQSGQRSCHRDLHVCFVNFLRGKRHASDFIL